MPEPGDYLTTGAVMRELGVTRQRVSQLRKANAFGECFFNTEDRCWLHPAIGVEQVRVWRNEEYDALTNPWPPWSQRDPRHRMPNTQEKPDGEA